MTQTIVCQKGKKLNTESQGKTKATLPFLTYRSASP